MYDDWIIVHNPRRWWTGHRTHFCRWCPLMISSVIVSTKFGQIFMWDDDRFWSCSLHMIARWTIVCVEHLHHTPNSCSKGRGQTRPCMIVVVGWSFSHHLRFCLRTLNHRYPGHFHTAQHKNGRIRLQRNDSFQFLRYQGDIQMHVETSNSNIHGTPHHHSSCRWNHCFFYHFLYIHHT